MKTLNICLLLIASFISYGQDLDCNQLTMGGMRNVPKDVCIPIGYNIREIFECGDVNLDGLNDYAFTYTRIKPEDGDTTFLSLFYAKSDTTFIMKKTYINLYPIIFKRYDFSYMVKDSLLNEVQGRYNGNYPLNWIKFLDGEIELSIIQAHNESLIFNFVYKKEKDDWLLMETLFIVGSGDQIKTTKAKYEGDEQISIGEFDYFDWL